MSERPQTPLLDQVEFRPELTIPIDPGPVVNERGVGSKHKIKVRLPVTEQLVRSITDHHL